MKNTDKEKCIISYLNWKFKQGVTEYLPCYTSPAVQDDFSKIIRKILEKKESSNKDIEIVKVLAPLTDSHNARYEYGKTSLSKAASRGHTEIVNILAPFSYNPNAPDNDGSNASKNMDILLFVRQHLGGIPKLSKSWPI